MSTQRYSVQKISTLPFAKFGCVVGGIVMFLPGLIFAIAGVQVISALRTLLDNWQSAQTDLLGLGVPVELDFIALLGLEAAQTLITRLDDQRVVVASLVTLVSVIGGGLLVALIVLVVGWVYNLLASLTGGLEVELRQHQSESADV